MSELNKKELLESLNEWKEDLLTFQTYASDQMYWGERDEQAYGQIEKMIKNKGWRGTIEKRLDKLERPGK